MLSSSLIDRMNFIGLLRHVAFGSKTQLSWGSERHTKTKNRVSFWQRYLFQHWNDHRGLRFVENLIPQRLVILVVTLSLPGILLCQEVILQGTIFVGQSKKYLALVDLEFNSQALGNHTIAASTNLEGYFKVSLPIGHNFVITAKKPLFNPVTDYVSTTGKTVGDTILKDIHLFKLDGSATTKNAGHEQRSTKVASSPNRKIAGRNLGQETGITRQAQKPIDRVSTADAEIHRENMIVEMLSGQRSGSSKTYLSIPSEYSGFKIQIIESRKPVSRESIKDSFPEGIWLQENENGDYTYLIGSFSHFLEASAYFDEKIASIYPNAKIIEFIRGSRL